MSTRVWALGVLVVGALARPAVADVHALFGEYWEHTLARSPEYATRLGDHRYADRLFDWSEEARTRHEDQLRVFRTRAEAIDRDDLSESDRLSLRLFVRELVDALEGAAFHSWQMPIHQLHGAHLNFPRLAETHSFETVELSDAYITRLRAFPAMIDQVIENLRAGISAGNVRYAGNMKKALPQIRRFAEMSVADHLLTKSPEDLGEEIPEPERDRIAIAIEIAVEESVIPAYQTLADFVETEYLPACRPEPGLGTLPQGKEYYAYLARHYTTTNLTPQEIHDIGLREMARIREGMEAIRRHVGFEGDLDAFFAHLRDDPSFYYESADELVQGFRDILAVMDTKMPALFGTLPEAPYDLKEMEEYRAASAPAAYYYPPPDDDSRPGYFYVNTHDLSSRPKYTMEALAYHEAVPGHHLQIAIQQELELPDFRRHGGVTAFVEGWGLYSERLPKEVGLYTDPYSDFGRLTFEAWRASRLVVDTGMHALGWSRGEAIAYLEANSALAQHDIEAEVDRYIATPGQALAYKIGQLKILELRDQARTELGSKFDTRRFHDALLRNGSVPLDVLEEIMVAWIRDPSSRAPATE